jgi:hypothetical protein
VFRVIHSRIGGIVPVSREDFSVGKAGFVAEHSLFGEEQHAAVKEVTDRLDGSDLKQVRVSGRTSTA